MDRGDFPAEIAEGVEEVDAGLVDEQSRVRAKEGLARQVGVTLPAVAHAHAQRDREQFTDRSGIELPAHFAVPRLPAKVLMDHEADAGTARGFDDGDTLLPRGG